MIIFSKGNIFDSNCNAIVNPVNTQGVSGKGLAFQFRFRFQDNNNFYISECIKKKLKPGNIYPFKSEIKKGAFILSLYIVNFTTKDKWRNPSEIEWIVSGLEQLKQWIIDNKIKSIGIPALGCGYNTGMLNWEEVKSKITTILSDLENVKIIVYEP